MLPAHHGRAGRHERGDFSAADRRPLVSAPVNFSPTLLTSAVRRLSWESLLFGEDTARCPRRRAISGNPLPSRHCPHSHLPRLSRVSPEAAAKPDGVPGLSSIGSLVLPRFVMRARSRASYRE